MTLAEYRAAIREDLDDTEYSSSVIDTAMSYLFLLATPM
jgi:hypothetical protein